MIVGLIVGIIRIELVSQHYIQPIFHAWLINYEIPKPYFFMIVGLIVGIRRTDLIYTNIASKLSYMTYKYITTTHLKYIEFLN